MSEEVIPTKILDAIVKNGCTILSNKQMGKTNLAKIIAAQISEKFPDICHQKIFDTAQVWRHSFLAKFVFQEINDNTTKVYDGNTDIIFDLEWEDSEQIMQFMGNAVLLDYQLNRERKKIGTLKDRIIYVIEEAQNSLGSYSLNRQSGRIWLKMISESGNFGLSFIFVGQRAADISTKAIERSQTFFIGHTTGDNNTMKIKNLIGSKAGQEHFGEPISEVAKRLKLGEFIFWSGEEAYMFNCPKFEDLYPNQKPQKIEPPRTRWLKLW